MTLRAQWLGQILREMRERKGLALREVAEYLQRNLATIGRCEQGIYPIRRVDAAAMMDLYGVSDKKQREAVLELAGEVWKTGWWEQYSKDNVWSSTIDRAWLENRSASMRSFSTITVPGLLQTEEYARALMLAADRHATKREIERWVDLRMRRQRVFDRDEPLHLSAVIDEAALHRPVGGPKVMADQIRHLLKSAALPHFDIHVLPYSVGAHASPGGPFTLFKMSDPFPEVAHVESPAGSIYLETEAVDKLVDTYDWLHEHSLSDEDTTVLLAALEKELR
ncbi:helix-turn-helix transcriptional regulator [Nocardiopsis sp. FIRDI 009]|uniref:helix-turn-helix domain-containing protein n=1 Tax=Nocardiopsis sp. FIRDI 009 TaxID=714197 RepID=UPI00130079C0|nr:helix-turn-helix transcriptional regulator [Nocardiopsis sp. FIRDI 009]